jgi:hypothetical protein
MVAVFENSVNSAGNETTRVTSDKTSCLRTLLILQVMKITDQKVGKDRAKKQIYFRKSFV